MNWDDLKFFTAVFRLENISQAAKELGLSPQTVARKIMSFEAKLGTTLFIRHPRGYKPTADAIKLSVEVERAEKILHTLNQDFLNKSQNLSGTVRIAAPELIISEILIPSFKPFLDKYPEIKLEFISGIYLTGIAKGEADIALRLKRPEQGALTIKKIGVMSSQFYTSHLNKNNINQSQLIGWDSNIDLPASRWLKKFVGREADIKFNSLLAQRAAIQYGLGIGILPCFISSELKQIEDTPVFEEPLWLITHSSSVSTSRIRLVYDQISMIISEHSSKLNRQRI